MLALVAYQLSKTPNALRTREEKAILLVSALGNYLSSVGYFGVGDLGPAVLLAVAPSTALAGLILEVGVKGLQLW